MAAPTEGVVADSRARLPASNKPKKAKKTSRYFDTDGEAKITKVVVINAQTEEERPKFKTWDKPYERQQYNQYRKKDALVARAPNKRIGGFSHFNVDQDALSSEDDAAKTGSSGKRKRVSKLTKRALAKEANGGSGRRRNPRMDPRDVPKEPVDPKALEKFNRGQAAPLENMKTQYHEDKYKRQERKVEEAIETAARAEVLLTESAGAIAMDSAAADDMTVESADLTQRDIADNVDFLSAEKHFELSLPHFGSYRMNYTRNGRFLLIGGAKGHTAAFDWQTKKLMCEMNVMETINDVKWLHIETMFAVAQKQWTYIYDNQGIELHCLKGLDCVRRMEFLPHHFLLATANSKGYLSYMDISVGEKVAGISTGMHQLDVMCQNPQNAIVHLGHSNGTVTLWSPNVKEPLVQMLCHGGAVRSAAVDPTGTYMATSGVDRYLKIWDMRMFKELRKYKVSAGAREMSFSQKGMLGAAIGNVVEVYDDCCRGVATKPYLTHSLSEQVSGLSFCPYEDVLGVTHKKGFASLLIPGSAEANFDALELNPYQTKEQRKHAEVKMLLDKIPADLITMDPDSLAQVDTETLHKKMEERNKLAHVKPQIITEEPRHKKKGRSKGRKLEARKQAIHEQALQEVVKKDKLEEKQQGKQRTQKDFSEAGYNPFGRFASKGS